jgi:hypothetical protein
MARVLRAGGRLAVMVPTAGRAARIGRMLPSVAGAAASLDATRSAGAALPIFPHGRRHRLQIFLNDKGVTFDAGHHGRHHRGRKRNSRADHEVAVGNMSPTI